jgi:protein-S-isoprenylcysteine O-methyltransferase Ste14
MGKSLFAFQLIFLGLLVYFADYKMIVTDIYLLILFLLVLAFVFYAFLSLSLELYSPFPEPVENHKLVTEGAYRLIRHPIYTALALVGFFLMTSNFNLISASIFALLLITFEITADFEEKAIAKRDSSYREYQKDTKKFIPWIY